MEIKQFIGKKFQRWTILEEGSIKKWNYNTLYYPLCQCECGSKKEVEIYSLIRGLSKSCGCYNRELASKRKYKHGYSNLPGTDQKNPDYEIWLKIKSRCINPSDKSYSNYGGRGITVSDDWKNSFDQFYKDMGPRPSKLHSIDRIDNNGNYCKENCKWSTYEKQANNRRNSKLIEYNGQSLSFSQWSRVCGIGEATIRGRFNKNLSLEKIFYKGNLRHNYEL